MAFVGHVDAITRAGVSGWAANPDDPATAAAVAVIVNGEARATGVADQPRPGLAASTRGRATDRSGFRIEFEPPLSPFHEFRVEVVEPASGKPLPGGVHTLSTCRQISGCANEVGEYVVGTKGKSHVNNYDINGKRLFGRAQLDTHTNPYVQEHTDLIESIRSSKPLNELKQVAESTLTAIMGRMSAYTGKKVTWQQALNTKEDLMPHNLTMQTTLPDWQVAIPGKTPLV